MVLVDIAHVLDAIALGRYFLRSGIGVVDAYHSDAMKTLRYLAARFPRGKTPHGNDFARAHVAIPTFPVHDGWKRRPGERAIEVAEKRTDEQHAQRAPDDRPQSCTRNLGTGNLGSGHQEPREGNIRRLCTAGSVRPVDQHGPSGRKDDIERVEIQVDETVTATGERVKPCRAGNLVETLVEPGQRGGVPAEGPRPSRDRLEHGGSDYALHDELGAIGTELLDLRRGVAMLGHVAHEHRVPLQRAPTAGAAKDESRPEVKDLRVAAGGKKGAELAHGGTLRHSVAGEVS